MSKIRLYNRSEDKALRIAKELKVKARPFRRLSEEAGDCDVLICTTASGAPLLGAEHFVSIVPKIIMDLSVPANISHSIYDNPDILYYSNEMIEQHIAKTLEKREVLKAKALSLVECEVQHFFEKVAKHDAYYFQKQPACSKTG